MRDTNSWNYGSALEQAVLAAKEAGNVLLEELRRPEGPRGTAGHSPADDEAEARIRRRLELAFPTFGIRGEELSSQDRASSDPHHHVWLLDPNDGTSAFVKHGARGSAVSIGLLRNGVPVLGVVFAYAAPNDQGDLLAWAEGCSFTRNGKPVSRAAFKQVLDSGDTVLVSHGADARSNANARYVAPARFRGLPSIAYRLALVAVGDAEACVSLNGPIDWDYGAGHALLRAFGGDFVDSSGQSITYSNTGASSCGKGCFAGSPAVARDLAKRNWRSVLEAEGNVSGLLDLVLSRRGLRIADPGVLSRVQGCLLGQFAGDSLGSLVEFRSAGEIKRRYPQGVRRLENGGTFGTLAGQPTDDSELALMLARTLLTVEAFDARAVATSYAAWYASGPFDIGSTTSQALSAAYAAHKSGSDPAAAAMAAANDSSQANGALMRVSPLAIFGWRLPVETLANLARMDARLTHPHQVCQDASAVYVVAIQRALQTGDPPAAVYAFALSWARSAGVHEKVLGAITKAESSAVEDFQVNMGWVLIALQNAFYQLLHAPSFEQGVVDTVVSGGDTDTNGCIAGALLGAAFGASSIPFQWIDRVLTCRPIEGMPEVKQSRPRCFWPVDALVLAEQLAAISS